MTDQTFDGSANWETHAFQVCWVNDYDVYSDLLNTAQDALIADYDLCDADLGKLVIVRAREIASQHQSLRLLESVDIEGHWERIDSLEVGVEVRSQMNQEGML